MFLGPHSGVESWRAPITKWIFRTREFAKSGAKTGMAINMYLGRAITTLAYPSNFILFPMESLRTERHIVCKLLHLPGNAIASSELFSMDRWHSYSISSCLAFNIASLMRSALVTHTIYYSLYNDLKGQVNNFIGEHALQDIPHLCQFLSPKNWDTVPMVSILHYAAL